MARTLAEWLHHIEHLHPRSMELGLERVRRVHAAMGTPMPAPLVVTVAGTNGKGSCVTWVEAICRAAGLRTLAYTSPHLQRYNERIRIDGQPISDEALMNSFEQVDKVRGDIPITFFEFGTLAAFAAGASAAPDIAALEVGLGGRLDAVNAIAADVAIVTSIGLDHLDWLGPDREAIGREKAGIFRAGRPAVAADRDLPQSVAETAQRVGARLLRLGQEFDYEARADAWHYRSPVTEWADLPHPAFGGHEQYANASAALAALEQLGPVIHIERDAVVRGLAARLPGRGQVIVRDGIEWWLDVAHNREAGVALAAALRQQPARGSTHAVAGFMRGKPVAAFAAAVGDLATDWTIVAAESERAWPAEECAAEFARGTRQPVATGDTPAAAFAALQAEAAPGDRVLVTGSFLVVGAALDYLTPVPR